MSDITKRYDENDVVSDAEFEANNRTWQKMEESQDRLYHVVDGYQRLLFLFGPQGIAKSTAANRILGEYTTRLEEIWRQQPPHERDPRRQYYDDLNIPRFVSPIKKLSGKTTPIAMFIALSDYNEPGEIVVLDDLQDDPLVFQLIHQATDRTNGFHFHWTRLTPIIVPQPSGELKEYDRKQSFLGSIVMISNRREGSDAFLKMFTPALLDRGAIVKFTYDVDDRFLYIDRMAFLKGGLTKFLVSPPPWGLSVVCTRDEAIAILTDVRNFFREHRPQINEPSFRMLELILSDRVRFPDGKWQQRARSHVK